MSEERISAQGDAVVTKFEINVEQLTPEAIEIIRELQAEGAQWSIEFEEPSAEVLSSVDFSLLDWKLEKGGFDPLEDAVFIQNTKELSVMADVASTKLKAKSTAAYNELNSFLSKLKSWFARMLHAYLRGNFDLTFYEFVEENLSSFVTEQQRTLQRLRLDSESVWGFVWLLTSKCKVKWHKDGERSPVFREV